MSGLAEALVAAQAEMPPVEPDKTNPPGTGVCQCGCGRPTNRAPQAYGSRGIQKGDYWRFVSGHNPRTHHRSKTKEYQQAAALKHNYGLSVDDFDAMAEAQDWKCYLCRDHRRLQVDHDHKTGSIRKLLCNGCNSRLSMVEDPILLARALAYLEEHS